MIALPGIVQDLLPQGVVDHDLVRIFAPSWNIPSVRRDVELIVRPETVIESEILGDLLIIVDYSCGTILLI